VLSIIFDGTNYLIFLFTSLECCSVYLISLMKFVTFSAVADVLIDAALILGGDTTLKILYMKLLEVCALDLHAYICSIIKYKISIGRY